MDAQEIRHPLQPIWDSQARILILGSFPSVKTRELGFYYGHKQNRFWPLLSILLGIDPPLLASQPDRATACLHEHKIALWDSILQCEITGSSDASIKQAQPTPLAPLIQNSQIQHIYCNGQSSFRVFQKYQSQEIHLPVTALPSTSPANASKSLDDLCQAWEVILKELS